MSLESWQPCFPNRIPFGGEAVTLIERRSSLQPLSLPSAARDRTPPPLACAGCWMTVYV
jgi:hypothetical protein